eukprot:g12034.t1
MDMEVDEEEAQDEMENCLVCAQCRFPIAFTTDMLAEQIPSWSDEVFSYELTVLDKSLYCYSATNPGKHRFDVARMSPVLAGRSVEVSGAATTEHSWFPGFAWQMASCITCDAHLGWAFLPARSASSASSTSSSPPPTLSAPAAATPTMPPATASAAASSSSSAPPAVVVSTTASAAPALGEVSTADPPLAFLGLILTRMAPAHLSDEKRTEMEEQRSQILAGAWAFQLQRLEAMRLLDALPLGLTASFHHMLQAFSYEPGLRQGMPSLLSALRGLHRQITRQPARAAQPGQQRGQPAQDSTAHGQLHAVGTQPMQTSGEGKQDGDAEEEEVRTLALREGAVEMDDSQSSVPTTPTEAPAGDDSDATAVAASPPATDSSSFVDISSASPSAHPPETAHSSPSPS